MFGAAAGGADGSMNKRSMKVFKDRASEGVKTSGRIEEILCIPRAEDFTSRPRPAARRGAARGPRPRGAESPTCAGLRVTRGLRAAAAGGGQASVRPAVCISLPDAPKDPDCRTFFTLHYGDDQTPASFAPVPAKRGDDEVPDNPDWRRINQEWLYSAEQLALDMNDQTNNASLVLAFELTKGGKVLLFAADAQRGNWASWARKDWKDGDEVVTARDLLGRTVLYKVGHHGSHNATLNGSARDEVPNLAWMATGELAPNSPR